MDIFSREAGSAKPGGHGFRGSGHVACGRIGGIDFNELLENVSRHLVLRRERVLLLGARSGAEHSEGADQGQKGFNHRAWIINSGSRKTARNTTKILIIKVWHEDGRANRLRRKWKMRKTDSRQVRRPSLLTARRKTGTSEIA